MLLRDSEEVWIGNRIDFDEINIRFKQIIESQLKPYVPLKGTLPADVMKLHEEIEVASARIEISLCGLSE